MSAADGARFGASADVRFDESLESLLDFLADRGLAHLELRQGYLDVNGTPAPGRLRSLADERDVTFTIHAPHVDCALGHVNEPLRRAAVDGVRRSLELAADAGAGGVIVHGGSARRRYPERVRRRAREAAVESIGECARYADELEVPLCLENQRDTGAKRRNTATPDRLAAFLEDVGVDSEHLRLTLDVGHAKATGVDYRSFVDRFGDRIHVAHLHDNDGTGDDHDPLPSFRDVAADVGARYNVLEMKSLADIDRCVGGEP
jgi:sugar phosphate isomerase/epimerase